MMANLPVPEVLFLRPSEVARSGHGSFRASDETKMPSAKGTGSMRSVREVMTALRQTGQSEPPSEIRFENAKNVGTFATEPPAPHFRRSTGLESGTSEEPDRSIVASAIACPQVTDLAAQEFNVPQTLACPQVHLGQTQVACPFVWPTLVHALVAQNGSQWDGIHAKILAHQKVGVLGMEPHCGTTSLAAALALSHVERRLHPVAPLQQPLILLDGDLSNPGLATALSLSNYEKWWDWSTATSTDLQQERVPNMVTKLPGNEQIRIWPLSCGISVPSHSVQIDEPVGASPNSARYFLPTQALGPITQIMSRVVELLTNTGSRVIIDLGHIDFWRRLQHLRQVAQACDLIIFVVPTTYDRRVVSKAYWDLRDSGQANCLLLENSR